MEKALYGVKITFRYTVRDDTAILEQRYEEMVLAIKAEGPDEVFAKAEMYAREYCDEYINVDGNHVKVEVSSISDCFEAFDEEDGIIEIYSKFYTAEGKPCAPNALRVLRFREFNGTNGIHETFS